MVAIAVRASEKILARDVFPDFSFHPYGLPIGGIEKTVELASIPMQIGFPPTQVGFIEYTNTNGEKSRVTACRQSFDPESAFINCLLSSFGQKLGLPTAPCVVDKEGNQAWFYSIIPYPHVIEANHLIEKTAGNITSRPGPHCEKWQRVRPLLERQQPADLEFRIFKDNIPFFSAEIPFNEWICYDDIGRHNLGVDLEAVEKAFRPGNNATAVIPVYRFDFCNRFDRWSEGSYHALSKALVNGEYGAYFYDSDEKKLALLNQLAQEAFLPFIDQGPMRKVISDIRNFRFYAGIPETDGAVFRQSLSYVPLPCGWACR
ncbi:MAG: hypothetical protein HY053_00340 [Proteobacteria bacterium]|nr:hypothetical protein [Pseudomonadota bacterium]